MKVFWDEARCEYLLSLREIGYSAGRIAAEMQVSRNAVIGRLHRMGYKSNRRPMHVLARPQRSPYKPPLKAASVEPSDGLEIEQLVSEPRPVNLFDAGPRHCRYPLWDDHRLPLQDKLFCGGQTIPGETYCPACRGKVYTQARPSAKDAA